jgi:flagellin-specific chaperone FliS
LKMLAILLTHTIQGDTFQECLENVAKTISLFKELGFTIDFEKSSLKLVQL